jgi:hypothetical protein
MSELIDQVILEFSASRIPVMASQQELENFVAALIQAINAGGDRPTIAEDLISSEGQQKLVEIITSLVNIPDTASPSPDFVMLESALRGSSLFAKALDQATQNTAIAVLLSQVQNAIQSGVSRQLTGADISPSIADLAYFLPSLLNSMQGVTSDERAVLTQILTNCELSSINV